MQSTLLVMMGGAIGSALRYVFGREALRLFGPGWPWGTLGVNVAGGLVMGLFIGWLAVRAAGAEALRLFFAVGILGGFTTFSSFSLEVVSMLQSGQILSALLYIMASVVLSVGALALGLTLMRAVAA